jgi:GxxExxY protein
VLVEFKEPLEGWIGRGVTTVTPDGDCVRETEPGERLDELAHAIIGAAIEVHRNLGPGSLESAYENALCVELKLRGIPFTRQHTVSVDYKGRDVGTGKIDILVDGILVVELKAVEAVLPVHVAQVISYLKVVGGKLGLLLNFNAAVMKNGVKRVVMS